MPPPTPADLQGFWEMVYLQVENVDALFADLEKLRANGWKVSTYFSLSSLDKISFAVVQFTKIVVAILIYLYGTIETDTSETKATARCKVNKAAGDSTRR